MMVISAGVSLLFLVQFTCLICQGKRGHYVISFARRDPDDQMSHVEEISDIDNYQSSTILWIWKQKNSWNASCSCKFSATIYTQKITPIRNTPDLSQPLNTPLMDMCCVFCHIFYKKRIKTLLNPEIFYNWYVFFSTNGAKISRNIFINFPPYLKFMPNI